MKNLVFWAVLLGMALVTIVSGLSQCVRTEELKRVFADQKPQFERESSYVVRTAEDVVLNAAKIQSGDITLAVVDEHGDIMDANALVGKKGIRFFFGVGGS